MAPAVRAGKRGCKYIDRVDRVLVLGPWGSNGSADGIDVRRTETLVADALGTVHMTTKK